MSSNDTQVHFCLTFSFYSLFNEVVQLLLHRSLSLIKQDLKDREYSNYFNLTDIISELQNSVKLSFARNLGSHMYRHTLGGRGRSCAAFNVKQNNLP